MKLFLTTAILAAGPLWAGPYLDDDGISSDDPGLTIWAEEVTVVRGPVDASVPDGAVASYGFTEDVIGPADASAPDDPYPVMSLGDGGWATIRFAVPIADGPGLDFAVFENGFSSGFLELAHVEVSSDGIHFVRFPSVSLTQTIEQVGGAGVDPIDLTDLHNLAGKYEAGVGTPFDLKSLRGKSPWLDVSRITHVRVIDVIGSIDPGLGSRDSEGNLINDPWKTSFISGGFDLDAVGAFYAAPSSYSSWKSYHFPSGGEDGDEDDPDKDGIVNVIEYATASDPLFPSGDPLRLSQGDALDSLQWTRARERPGADSILKMSSDLTSWEMVASSMGGGEVLAEGEGVFVEESAANSEVSVSLPSTTGRRFYRLEISR